jgi:hypothetical protein
MRKFEALIGLSPFAALPGGLGRGVTHDRGKLSSDTELTESRCCVGKNASHLSAAAAAVRSLRLTLEYDQRRGELS